MQWFIALFGLSRSLSEELLRSPAWTDTFGDLRASFSEAEMADRLHEFLETRTPRSTALDLALFRRHEMTRIVLRDALGFATLAETTYQLSNLADAILSFALSDVFAAITERHGTPIDASSNPARPARFTVIALGKLGGQELNYSSDIDLMFLYSGNGETSGPHSITNKEFFKKVANQLTGQLSAYTAAGICYRTDLRLRPEGKLGEICIALDAAKEYYKQRARDWELQMLIKARVTAGDVELGAGCHVAIVFTLDHRRQLSLHGKVGTVLLF